MIVRKWLKWLLGIADCDCRAGVLGFELGLAACARKRRLGCGVEERLERVLRGLRNDRTVLKRTVVMNWLHLINNNGGAYLTLLIALTTGRHFHGVVSDCQNRKVPGASNTAKAGPLYTVITIA